MTLPVSLKYRQLVNSGFAQKCRVTQ